MSQLHAVEKLSDLLEIVVEGRGDGDGAVAAEDNFAIARLDLEDILILNLI